jgi:glycosyltransferase involved in cell wall biosynthesis
MRILITLTYYRPHYSGLTIYAERLASALVRRGHQVTVLTSRFNARLPQREILNGVEVIRVRPLFRISKGLIMPTMFFHAWRLARHADVLNLHMPQLDASYISWIGKLLRKPVVLTYQCDLRLPKGIIHTIANKASQVANHIAAQAGDSIVSITQDYAENSSFLQRYINKVRVIDAPVELTPAVKKDIEAFRIKFHIHPGQRIIGMAARLATEKGVEYVVQALPMVLEKIPGARVLFVGPYKGVVGEEKYAKRIMPLIKGLEGHWSFLGVISPVEMTAFFKISEVLILPSLNSTEGFGLVQAEAMTCGTPVIASDLPGVRMPVKISGMGKLVPPGDAGAIADSICEILAHPAMYEKKSNEFKKRWSPDEIARQYDTLFHDLMDKAR